MAERGGKLNHILDFYIGIPLTLPIYLARKLDKFFIKKRIDNQGELKFAVLCMGAIGDLLLVSGLINALRSRYKGSVIHLYTTVSNASAAELIDGVDNTYSFPLSSIFKAIFEIRSQSYDVFFDTTQWARLGALISGLSRASKIIGFKTKAQFRSLIYDIKVSHNANAHEKDNFLSLGKSFDNKLTGKPSIIINNLNKKDNIFSGNYVVFHMWASGSNVEPRQWPSENWVHLAEKCLEHNYAVLLSGSPKDYIKNDTFIINNQLKDKNVFNIASKYELAELVHVFKSACAVVSVNTGPMHLAALCGTIVIGLCGPTNPLRWGPVGDKSYFLMPDNAGKMLHLGFEKADESSYSCNISYSAVEKLLFSLIK